MPSQSPSIASRPDLRSPKVAQLRRGFLTGCLRITVLVVFDIVAIALAWYLAIVYGSGSDSAWIAFYKNQLLPLVLITSISVIAARRLYGQGPARRDYLGMIKAVSLSEILLILTVFLYEPDYQVSRFTFLLSWVFGVAFVSAFRFGADLITEVARHRGVIRYPVFLICEPEEQEFNIRLIEHECRYNIIGIENPRALDRAYRDTTFESLRQMGVVEAFVSWSSIWKRLHLCWHFQTAGIILRILPTQQEPFFPKSEFWSIGNVPCLTIPTPVIVGSDYWIKRSFDFCCALILLLLLSPVYIVISLLIKLDSPGSIFFRQTRVGLHNRPFKVWKFRTMVANAEKLQKVLEAQNEMKDGVLFKMKDDPRITRIGKFLRQYSLDELPQIFNVLVGEMSLVGPRPLPMRDVERFDERHFIRQEVLPGITGLWQVSGRSDIDNFEDAINLDLTYIVNWSIWLDVKILFQTLKVVFDKAGAY